jgi:RHS repeat-associated protein
VSGGRARTWKHPSRSVSDFRVSAAPVASTSHPSGGTDALNHTTAYSYDNLERRTLVDYPSGTDPSFSYDSGDLLTSFSDATGTTTREYDDLGRLTSESKGGRTFSYTYDPIGNRASMTDPDNRVFAYSVDTMGRILEVTLDNDTQVEYEYSDDGNMTLQTNANGTYVEQTWDDAGRLTEVYNRAADDTVLSSFVYTLNDADLRTGVTEADDSTVSWGYDALHRLTSETRTGTDAFTASYSLDPVGNWSSRTVNNTTTNYSYTDADRITAAGSNSYSWNDDGTLASRTAGSTTTSFTWDYEAQLTGIGSSLSFGYDALGRRVSRTSGSTTTTFCLDGNQVALEKQGSTTTANYIYGDTLVARGSETMMFDGHGSLRTVTNSSGSVTATGNWEAYGQAVGGTGSSSTPYQYGATSGYRNDEDAGLLHIGARWYDPAVGRWISADTHLGDAGAPLSHNRYLYCEGDPVCCVDPSGHGLDEDPKWVQWAKTGGRIIGGFFAILTGIKAWESWTIYSIEADTVRKMREQVGRWEPRRGVGEVDLTAIDGTIKDAQQGGIRAAANAAADAYRAIYTAPK